jgi:2,4-dienoyl-CoA reductase-like NADH-dependent reductase (Old Yellow Enzyme family)
MPSLFDPFDLGHVRLANRIVMAPMTRSRARNSELAPDADVALYYAQRAGAGLIVSEGAPISVQGRGWAFTPGIYTPAQIVGWRNVADAVHAKGGRIFVQIWHVGRASHVSHQKDGQAPVSSVDIQAQGVVSLAFDETGEPAYLPQSKPRALSVSEISDVINDFVLAARNACVAKMDGIELHAANGYLFEQFISGSLNNRTDGYGGASITNRLRFTLETVDAVTAAIGAERIGIRLAPFGRYNDMHPFEGEGETWLTLAAELSKRQLAYVHLSDQATLGAEAIPGGFVDKFRRAYSGRLIIAGGFARENAQLALDAGRADLIAIGRPFISNPDLVERLRNGWPLTAPDRSTFYRGGRNGYTDYPPWDNSAARSEARWEAAGSKE